MNNRITKLFLSATAISPILLMGFASPAFAQSSCPVPAGGGCYDWTGTPPTLGCYLECALPSVWGVVQVIFVAIAVIMTMYLIFKTVTNRDNPEELSQLPTKWMYLIILILLAVGAGGTLLNIVLRFLGFGDFTTWLNVINQTLEGWR